MKINGALAIILIVLGSLSAACGSSPTAPSAPPPPPPTFSEQRLTGSLGAQRMEPHDITATRNGNLTLEAAWPGGADLDLYLTDTGCSDPAYQRTCQFYGSADSATQNPERVTRTVTSGSYRVWVVNASRVTTANYTLNVRVDFNAAALAATASGGFRQK